MLSTRLPRPKVGTSGYEGSGYYVETCTPYIQEVRTILIEIRYLRWPNSLNRACTPSDQSQSQYQTTSHTINVNVWRSTDLNTSDRVDSASCQVTS
jgi:hypothetical protein